MDKTNNPWTRDESKIVAITDYKSVDQVRCYDERMGTIRNVDQENQFLLSYLNLTSESSVLEIGTGTGAFARAASKVCKSVTAVDVSPVMLEYARLRAEEESITNIDFCEGGFISFDAPAGTYDAVVSSLALHHLPDVWKGEAVTNIYRWLKPNGIFLLVDIVFDCDCGQLDQYVEKFIPSDMNEPMKQAFYGHIREEYSTYCWVMEGILQRSGFEIESRRDFGHLPFVYQCRKPG